MTHDHSHGAHGVHGGNVSETRLKLSVFLTLSFVLGEAAAGYYSNSLALMSDAGHNFADALALSFTWYAVAMAQRRSTSKMTFGYHRVGILAALVNAVFLVIIAILISWEAFHRFSNPKDVQSALMIGVAAIALIVNVIISRWLHAGKDNLNIRGAYLHMVGDAVSALGVIMAGIVVAMTKSSVADPIVSFVIAALIVWSSFGILLESITVLLEGTPDGVNMSAVEDSIKNIAGVLNFHDLHVWTVGPGVIACSCHVMVSEQSIRSGQQILNAVVEELTHRFHINHTTIQIEVEGCSLNEMYCNMKTGHHHIADE